ncbi:MAG: FecR family protein [Rhodanobacteraceae bacterium]
MTDEDAKPHIDTRVRGEAERWLARLLDVDKQDPAWQTFERWRRADPAHASAYRHAERLWALGREAAQHPELQQAAARMLFPARVSEPRRFHSRLVPALAAAAIVVVVLGLGALGWRATMAVPSPGTRYVTKVGQQQTIALPDGSSLLLDTDSAVVVRYGRDLRQVKLERGRAEFSVIHSPGEPFIVHAGGGTVTDIGTRFQVSIGAHDNVNVILLQGSVAVAAADSHATLTQGETLKFDRSGIVGVVHKVDLADAVDWTRGEVVAKNWPLPRLLAQMNRYSTVKIRIADPSLDTERVTGAFHVGDQQTLVKILESGWPIRAEQTSGGAVILRHQ